MSKKSHKIINEILNKDFLSGIGLGITISVCVFRFLSEYIIEILGLILLIIMILLIIIEEKEEKRIRKLENSKEVFL